MVVAFNLTFTGYEIDFHFLLSIGDQRASNGAIKRVMKVAGVDFGKKSRFQQKTYFWRANKTSDPDLVNVYGFLYIQR